MTSRCTLSGPVAHDKDLARDLRKRVILPSVQRGLSVVLDFSQVQLATQSFIHALLSEVFRSVGEDAVGLLEFRGCTAGVRSVIETVAQYSLHARQLATKSLAGVVRSVDVPQADRLATVRGVVDAAAGGKAFSRAIAESVGTSMRHVHYRLNAARILGFVEMYAVGIVLVADAGEELAATTRDSEEERKLFIRAIKTSDVVRKLAPQLLVGRPPRRHDVVQQIVDLTGLSQATADRRARVLLSWRRQVRSRVQLSLWTPSRAPRE